jgi:hypothetical protein
VCTALQAFSFLPISTMVLTLFWTCYLHPVKALRHDKLGLVMMAASHVVKSNPICLSPLVALPLHTALC